MPSIKDIMEKMDYGPAIESDAEVRNWLATHSAGIGHFINGCFVAPEGPMSDVINPANEEVIARLSKAGPDQIDAAVKAARAAQPKWASLEGHVRARYLYAIARQVQKKERFLAVLETIDNGKTIRETRDCDIPLVARHFYHHAGWAELLDIEFRDYKPVGVCGQVIPWNFPLLMLAWKIAPALATGNTVVLKPSDLTPLTAQAFAEICIEIGLPKGVVNIVHGDGETGALLTGHPDVDKVAFTGSTRVGRLIREQTAGSGKKLSLELGGKSPFIVFEDADQDAAVEGVVDAIWFNQGEVCCAGSRIIVQEGIAESFFARLKARLSTLRIGDPLDKANDVGAIVSRPQLERIQNLLAAGMTEGAVLHSAPGPLPNKGFFCAPGFFTETAPAHRVNREEIFGPIATTLTFRTPEEAVLLANDTRYGLAASIWSQDIDRAIAAAAKVKAGVIWINSTNLFDAGAAFGGYRESGYGREGSRAGLFEYLLPSRSDQLSLRPEPNRECAVAAPNRVHYAAPAINITAKLYIGGKQVRADSGQSYPVMGKNDVVIGHAALGNRKDIRNAVEAAAKVDSWGNIAGHNRAQVLYFLAENLSQRSTEFAELLVQSTGATTKAANSEVEAAIRRCFWYAAYADKFAGALQSTKQRHVTLSLNEPWGVMGLVCPDEMPLLSMLSLILPAIAMGNSVVTIASQSHPLVASTFYQVLETSDIPNGVVNLITGTRDDLAKTLAEHDEVACLWYCGSKAGSTMVEQVSFGNLKAVWTDGGYVRDWLSTREGYGEEYLRRATQVKTVWLPFGE